MASVFISYSHLDEAWKDRLVRHFRLFELQGLAVEAWHDRRIPGGGDWEAEIQKAMAEADAAILLVSADSLGSKFINEREVPFLLGRSKADGLPVVPVVVRPCTWKLVPWLTKLNLRPRDGHPLSAGTDHEIEAQLAAIAEEVFHFAKRRAASEPEDDPKRSSASRADWLLVHPYGMPPNFTGRVPERGQLTEWLGEENGPALLVLRALGGFGKSALVWHWLMKDLYPARWPRVVWWSFYDDPSFDAFLGEVLNYLGLDAKTPTVRDGMLLLLGALHRSRILLVLDGFERALRAFAQLDAAYHLDDDEKRLGREEERDCVSPAAEAFLRAVSSLPGLAGRVLLTTRLRPRPVETRAGELFAGCREIELTALSKGDAVEFFHTEGIQGTRAEIEAVCGHYGFHPLSLRLLAGMIVKDLRNPRDIVVAQRLDVSGDLIQRKHHVLEQSYMSLPLEERRMLSRIASFRGSVSSQEILAASGGLTDIKVTAAVNDLVGRGLLYRDPHYGLFDLHPIVRVYAFNRLTIEERKEARSPLIFRSHPIEDGCPPAWASGWGEDEFGIFAEISVGEATQRMRWIEPREFWMGSQEDEPGRWGDEGPRHLEVIEEGFWLADTPCTQAVWEGVMGINPSRFRTPDRPVEQVSWEDCQEFCQKLGERLGGPGWRLPGEVEWEYACRAGTETATCAGPIEIRGERNAPVLGPIAWYGGNSGDGYDLEEFEDSSGWPEKEIEHARAGTRRVAAKAPNGWGLYDTLGNVWEWCEDFWSGAFDTAQKGPFRVVRGGSWNAYARYVRAANRGWPPPGARRDDLGFRLARGQESALRQGAASD